jgi:hypothetical protein
VRTQHQHSWQVKGFKALPVAIVVAAELEAYMGNQNFILRPDTTGSVFLGDAGSLI